MRNFRPHSPGSSLMTVMSVSIADVGLADADDAKIWAHAVARNATLLTGDPEILQRDLDCRTQDLRPT